MFYNSFSDIYRTNMFHLTSTGCALVLQKDLEYWGIDELMMEPCCALKYYPEIETCVNEKQVIFHDFWSSSTILRVICLFWEYVILYYWWWSHAILSNPEIETCVNEKQVKKKSGKHNGAKTIFIIQIFMPWQNLGATGN